MPTDDEAIPYPDALMRLNDLSGTRVEARVCDSDGVIMRTCGVLRHDTEKGMWASYTVGEVVELDLGVFQQFDRHWGDQGGRAVAFYMPSGTRVDVWRVSEA